MVISLTLWRFCITMLLFYNLCCYFVVYKNKQTKTEKKPHKRIKVTFPTSRERHGVWETFLSTSLLCDTSTRFLQDELMVCKLEIVTGATFRQSSAGFCWHSEWGWLKTIFQALWIFSFERKRQWAESAALACVRRSALTETCRNLLWLSFRRCCCFQDEQRR